MEAQDEIRTKLQDEERKKQIHDYIEKLRKVTYIWTVFDQLAQQPPGDRRYGSPPQSHSVEAMSIVAAG